MSMKRFERFIAWCEDVIVRAEHGDKDARFLCWAAAGAVLAFDALVVGLIAVLAR